MEHGVVCTDRPAQNRVQIMVSWEFRSSYHARLPITPVYCADRIPFKNYDPLTCIYNVSFCLKSHPFFISL